jgi:DNA-binding response OmpR family regulator
MSRVLIVEDDARMARELATLLESRGFESVVADVADDIAAQVESRAIDLVLLDLGLPVLDGTMVAKGIRESSDVGIIVLTSRTTETDEVLSMSLGADDFIAKPYSPHVLLARIEALLRRSGKRGAKTVLESDGLRYDVDALTVRGPAGSATLTRNEGRLLALLMRRRGAVVSREELMCELWDSDAFVDDNTLTVNIARLRQKLESVGIENVLTTHRGVGYAFS